MASIVVYEQAALSGPLSAFQQSVGMVIALNASSVPVYFLDNFV
jgi:hypothetical protein